MTCSRFFCALLLFLVLVPPAWAMESQPIEMFHLTNGMQVILVPSHRVPAVTHMLIYKVGAADDYPGYSGLAHYNEHMMFQGTPKVPAGEFGRIIAAGGGRFNAFTTRDFTAYHESIAKDRLPMVMELEADRMLNLAPTTENFTKERQVIIEERRMRIENRPEALLAEEMQAMLFRNSPYHNPVIGWMHEMQALSRDEVLAFHRQFYHPANAILVVAGDITRKELEPLAEKYYGHLAAGETYVRQWRTEPPQRGPRHIEIRHKNVTQPQLVRYYTAPSVHGEGRDLVMPGFVLAQLLGGGPTSRLYQSLVVKQKMATDVSVSYDGIAWGEGTLEIDATPAPGITLPQLETALDKELEAYTTQAESDSQDLERAKTLLKAEVIYARDSQENMARTVGELVAEGLPAEYFNKWPDRVEKVTGADIRKAMLAIFKPQDSVTGYLLPAEKGGR